MSHDHMCQVTSTSAKSELVGASTSWRPLYVRPSSSSSSSSARQFTVIHPNAHIHKTDSLIDSVTVVTVLPETLYQQEKLRKYISSSSPEPIRPTDGTVDIDLRDLLRKELEERSKETGATPPAYGVNLFALLPKEESENQMTGHSNNNNQNVDQKKSGSTSGDDGMIHGLNGGQRVISYSEEYPNNPNLKVIHKKIISSNSKKIGVTSSGGVVSTSNSNMDGLNKKTNGHSHAPQSSVNLLVLNPSATSSQPSSVTTPRPTRRISVTHVDPPKGSNIRNLSHHHPSSPSLANLPPHNHNAHHVIRTIKNQHQNINTNSQNGASGGVGVSNTNHYYYYPTSGGGSPERISTTPAPVIIRYSHPSSSRTVTNSNNPNVYNHHQRQRTTKSPKRVGPTQSGSVTSTSSSATSNILTQVHAPINTNLLATITTTTMSPNIRPTGHEWSRRKVTGTSKNYENFLKRNNSNGSRMTIIPTTRNPSSSINSISPNSTEIMDFSSNHRDREVVNLNDMYDDPITPTSPSTDLLPPYDGDNHSHGHEHSINDDNHNNDDSSSISRGHRPSLDIQDDLIETSQSVPTTEEPYRLTTERLAYILIGSCCALSILCLIVVAFSIRCRDMCEEYKAWKKAEKLALYSNPYRYPHQRHVIRHGLNGPTIHSEAFFTPASGEDSSGSYPGLNVHSSRPIFGPSCCCCPASQFAAVGRAGPVPESSCPRGYFHPTPRGKLPFGAASSVHGFLQPRTVAINNVNFSEDDDDSLNSSVVEHNLISRLPNGEGCTCTEPLYIDASRIRPPLPPKNITSAKQPMTSSDERNSDPSPPKLHHHRQQQHSSSHHHNSNQHQSNHNHSNNHHSNQNNQQQKSHQSTSCQNPDQNYPSQHHHQQQSSSSNHNNNNNRNRIGGSNPSWVQSSLIVDELHRKHSKPVNHNQSLVFWSENNDRLI